MNSARLCAYCGLPGDLTLEHVIPDCFQRTLDIIAIAKTRSGDKAIRSAQGIADVCASCNNGYLSQLDAYLCELASQYFSTPIRPGDRIRFVYDFDRLLRVLLKIGYNVGRTRNWPLDPWKVATKYIADAAPRAPAFRMFLQLMIPARAEKIDLPVTPNTTEIGPMPFEAQLKDVESVPGIEFEYSVSFWSYRFCVLRENLSISKRTRERCISNWLKGTRGAYELTQKGVAKVFASSITALEVSTQSPVFRSQLSLARGMARR